MSKEKRFSSIKRIRQIKEDEVIKRLGAAQRNLNESEHFLGQLSEYRSQYLAKLQEKLRQNTDSSTLQNYHHFMQQLDAVIAKQRNKIQENQHHVHQQQSDWRKANRETESLSWLINKMQAEQQLAENRREQRITDEYGQRKKDK